MGGSFTFFLLKLEGIGSFHSNASTFRSLQSQLACKSCLYFWSLSHLRYQVLQLTAKASTAIPLVTLLLPGLRPLPLLLSLPIPLLPLLPLQILLFPPPPHLGTPHALLTLAPPLLLCPRVVRPTSNFIRNIRLTIYDRQGSAAFIADALAQHNAARAKYNAPPVTWNTALYPSTQVQVDTCVFAHRYELIHSRD